MRGTGRQHWKTALEGARRDLDELGEGALLFLEEREDLAVEADAADSSSIRHTHLRGASVRGPFAAPHQIHLSDPTPDDLPRLLRRVREGLGDPGGAPAGPTEAHARECVFDPDAVSAVAEAAAARAERERPGASVRVRWVGSSQRVWIGTPDRAVVEDSRIGRRLRVEAWLDKGDLQGRAVAEAVLGESDDAQGVADRLAREAARRVDERVACRAVAPGERAVVLAPGVGGVLIHEIVGHALEADAALLGSWLAGREGPVGSALLEVIDDPRRGRVAWHHDDEGEPAKPTPLIHRGHVRAWLTDQSSARRARRPRSGHGRRFSYREPVRPRMGCTFIGAGALEPEEVVGSVSDGIYVRRMESASVDPRTGRAVFRVSDADAIRDGRRAGPLESHLMFVDAPLLLDRIDRIAGDLEFDSCVGSCHRDGQPMAVSVGAPTIRIGLVGVGNAKSN